MVGGLLFTGRPAWSRKADRHGGQTNKHARWTYRRSDRMKTDKQTWWTDRDGQTDRKGDRQTRRADRQTWRAHGHSEQTDSQPPPGTMNDGQMLSLVVLITALLALTLSLEHPSHDSCNISGFRHGNGRLRCQSCNTGCHGSNCSSTCQGRCDGDGCDRSTGECFRCRPGFYGRHCDTPCPPRCSSSPGGGAVYCDRHTGACSESCGGGWTRAHCDGRCPPNCKGLSSVCHIQTGECLDDCDGRWAGGFCNMTCDNCLMGRCSITGYCLHGCEASFYGQKCEDRCQHCWTSGCDRQTGICEQCQPGNHGHRCSKTCPEKCYKGRDGHKHCDRHTAVCQEGCETG